MSAVEVPRHRWTRDEYAMLEELRLKCELIEGEIVDVSPMNPRHANVTNRLARMLDRQLDETRFTVGSQTPIVLSDISEPEPDIWVTHVGLRELVGRKPETGDLALVVEVSDTKHRFDRDVKLSMYASAGVTLVWIVDLNTTSSRATSNLNPHYSGL